MDSSKQQQLGDALSDAEYLRQRTEPAIAHPDFLHLKDLYRLMREQTQSMSGDVFDYGCGGAPYRNLFKHCKRYLKADVTPGPHVDRLLTPTGGTNEPPASFDFVVSTQVLEHVQFPSQYLQECRRLLRPGGQLFLTTHGLIEEHGCPYDFYRWTSRGLETLIEAEGFKILESGKITTEIRAVVQLLNQMVRHLRYESNPWIHYPLAVARKVYLRAAMPLLNWGADRFSRQAIVPGSDSAGLYTAIYARAAKS
jgi:SAM-dependent methyltransferase